MRTDTKRPNHRPHLRWCAGSCGRKSKGLWCYRCAAVIRRQIRNGQIRRSEP